MTAQKRTSAKKAAPRKAAAKKAAPRRRASAQPEGLHLRKSEAWVAMDGTNIRHVAELDSEEWTAGGRPICGARPIIAPFVETGAKLPVCDNCKTAW